ncbi:transcriptional regulator [Catenovulum agarivorans DS-2]|uniref:Transcriptional regulator n=1 Tax=Catenovulum agarivorans DS-2 TaxID=1328313 RepID=W7QRA2_9ALTE|nr:GGDEF domain-containing protein [Catenovulum agarivorans]EWH10398.1 transcriptional regulator [Catenovulum agarivorans DS-2]
MVKRQRIGLIITEIVRNNNLRIFKSLKQECARNNALLVVFEGRCLTSQNYGHQQQNFIYRFVSKQSVDGLIVTTAAAPDEYSGEHFNRHFLAPLNNNVVNYYFERPMCHSIRLRSGGGAALMTEHLVKDHGYKTFALMRGPVNSIEANQRFDASMQVLRQHGLAEHTQVYQLTWNSAEALQVAKKILAQDTLPQAMIFPNDESAIAVLDYINNFKPELTGKIAIVGFDNSTNSKLISPQLTTVEHPHEKMSADAVRLLTQANPKEPQAILHDTPLIYRQSCGCNIQTSVESSAQTLFTEDFNLYDNTQSLNYSDFFAKLTTALELRGITGCYISCYLDDAFEVCETTEPPQYSELIYCFHKGQRRAFESRCMFPTLELLPDEHFKADDFSCLVVRNLFYANSHFGFVVFDIEQGRLQDLQELSVTIATTLNTIRMLDKMQKLAHKNQYLLDVLQQKNAQLASHNKSLERMSTIDDMTQVNNRRGFYQNFDYLFKNSDSSQFTFFYADLDNLKKINDSFSHAAGDTAIKLAADCLKKVFRDTDIVARMGGDEFVIAADIDAFTAQNIINRLQQKVETINLQQNLVYHFGISIGYYSFARNDFVDIEYAIKRADEVLYDNKRKRKAKKAQ